MPKLKAPKIINQEIMKAIQYLTNQDIYVTVTLSDIVERVRTRVKNVEPNQNLEKLIKEAIYKLRDLGLIGYVGHNQYCCAECFANDQNEVETMPTPQPTPKPGQPDPGHFKPNPQQKSMPEKKSSLDPNRKHRNSEDPSSKSLSGDEFERTRKRFYGTKKIEKGNPNTPLPGARQVTGLKRTFLDMNSESSSGDECNNTFGAIKARQYLSKSSGAKIEEISSYNSDESLCGAVSKIPKSIKRSKMCNAVDLMETNIIVPAENDLQSVKNVSAQCDNTSGADDKVNENVDEKFENSEKDSKG